jgi:hypothetical protein
LYISLISNKILYREYDMMKKHKNSLELHDSMQANSEVSSMVYHGSLFVSERIQRLNDMCIDYQNRHESTGAIAAIRCGIELLEIPAHCIELAMRSCGPNTYFVTVTFRLNSDSLGQVLIKKTRLLIQLVNKLLFGKHWKQRGVSLSIHGALEKHTPSGGGTSVHWHTVINAPESHPKTEDEVIGAFEKAMASSKLLNSRGRSYFDDVLSRRDELYTDEHWCNYICKNLLHRDVLDAHDQWGAGFYEFRHDDLLRINTTPPNGLVAKPVRQVVEVDAVVRATELEDIETFMASRVPDEIQKPSRKHSGVIAYM